MTLMEFTSDGLPVGANWRETETGENLTVVQHSKEMLGLDKLTFFRN